MKKGFTLVELIAVICILALFAIVFVPSVINILSDNSNKIYKVKEEKIKEQAYDYSNYCDDFVFPVNNETKYIKLDDLKTEEYIDKILDNNGEECDGYIAVTVNSTYGYNYDVCLICEEYITNATYCSQNIYDEIGI